jgi:hypothetical protein
LWGKHVIGGWRWLLLQRKSGKKWKGEERWNDKGDDRSSWLWFQMKENLPLTQESSFPCIDVDSEGGNMMVWSEDSDLEKTKEKSNETQWNEMEWITIWAQRVIMELRIIGRKQVQ